MDDFLGSGLYVCFKIRLHTDGDELLCHPGVQSNSLYPVGDWVAHCKCPGVRTGKWQVEGDLRGLRPLSSGKTLPITCDWSVTLSRPEVQTDTQQAHKVQCLTSHHRAVPAYFLHHAD